MKDYRHLLLPNMGFPWCLSVNVLLGAKSAGGGGGGTGIIESGSELSSESSSLNVILSVRNNEKTI